MSKPKKEIIATEEHKLPVVTGYEDDADFGFENHTKDDYAVPFLNVLQALSPIIESEPSAKAGMFFNSVTKELFDGKEGVKFIVVLTQQAFIEWKPNRGGFVARHEITTDFVRNVRDTQEWGKYKVNPKDANSNDLIHTVYVYGIIIRQDGTTEKIIFPISGTKFTPYKGWMNRARSIVFRGSDNKYKKFPLWAHRWLLTTNQQKNTKGTFYNMVVKFDGKDAEEARIAADSPLYVEAKEFYHSIIENKVTVAEDTLAEHGGAAESVVDEEIPF